MNNKVKTVTHTQQELEALLNNNQGFLMTEEEVKEQGFSNIDKPSAVINPDVSSSFFEEYFQREQQ